MSEHTPGPWKLTADPYPEGCPYWKIDACPGFYHDEDVGDGKPSLKGFSLTFISNEADAHLIAAAPEMLEALKDAWRYLSKSALPDGLAKIEAAIAKAEGRT